MSTSLPCTQCDAPCAAVCAPHSASAHPATAPRALLHLAAGGPHPLLNWCTRCGCCEGICPYDVPVTALLRSPMDPRKYARLLAHWQQTDPWHSPTVVWAGCETHGVGVDGDKLRAALQAHHAKGVVVAAAMRCGGPGTPLDGQFSDLIAHTHAAVRTVVVPTGACRGALSERLEDAGLRGRYVAVADQWLARFGVSLPASASRFSCCTLRRDARESDPASTAIWPPFATCCGAGEPLRSADPATADATARALLARWQAANISEVHVEDALCAGHLRQAAAAAGCSIEIVTRLEAFSEGIVIALEPAD
ncbi:MAG: hypothetical protein KC502_13360 [Myxococcales bacterium]|nr:hypothetical protein [Myxococcales bacterium]